MTSEEKRAWIYAVIAAVVPVVYFASVLGQLGDTDAADIAYVRPLLTAIIGAIILNIVGNIVLAILSPKDADRTDERDRQINRFGEYIGYYVVSVVAVISMGLAMLEADYFWIANSLYLAFTLAALVSSVVKIVSYRRSF